MSQVRCDTHFARKLHRCLPLCFKYDSSSRGRLVFYETMLPCLSLPTPPRLTTTRQKACEYSWGLPIQDYPLLADGDFDVVICSDLLYDPIGWEPLLASLRQLTARRGRLGQRRGWETRPSLPPPAAAASAAPPPAVAYLAHRIRNAQEREFFSLLLPGGGGGGPGGGDKAGEGSGAELGQHENGLEEDRSRVPSFTCRKLEGEAPQRETWAEGERAGLGGGYPFVRCRPEGEGGTAPVWRRGCFPDVALYELSPIQAVGRAQRFDCVNATTVAGTERAKIT